jgi:hypothetical protein
MVHVLHLPEICQKFEKDFKISNKKESLKKDSTGLSCAYTGDSTIHMSHLQVVTI